VQHRRGELTQGLAGDKIGDIMGVLPPRVPIVHLSLQPSKDLICSTSSYAVIVRDDSTVEIMVIAS
jgi:hypothetical protein